MKRLTFFALGHSARKLKLVEVAEIVCSKRVWGLGVVEAEVFPVFIWRRKGLWHILPETQTIPWSTP